MERQLDAPFAADDRLRALHASGLLGTSVDPTFDRLTRLATAALDVPVAIVSLVDDDRQFFKSQCGLPEPWATRRETPLSHSFCRHVVSTGKPFLVSDARRDPRVIDNDAIEEIGVIAYAGVPLVDADGLVLGAMGAIDTRPREWTPRDVELLRSLAAQVMFEVQLRKRSDALAAEVEQRRDADAERRTMARLTVHDLRTPLAALVMGVDLLPRLGKLSVAQSNAVAICRRNGEVLMALIDDLLDIGAAEVDPDDAMRRRPCSPATLTASAIDQVAALAADKSIALVVTPFDAAGGPPAMAVAADCDKLVRVLVNLLGNAIKFTPPGGRVSVDAAVDDGDSAMVRWRVVDTGIGIADGDRIFDEGFRADADAPTRRSAGLGLTFCKRTIEAHGGRITFETELGVGSTFSFTVPLHVG